MTTLDLAIAHAKKIAVKAFGPDTEVVVTDGHRPSIAVRPRGGAKERNYDAGSLPLVVACLEASVRKLHNKKREELYAAAAVAAVRGGIVIPEVGEWPDAWIQDENENVPVEVVRAFCRPEGEDTAKGAISPVQLKKAEAKAAKLKATGADPLIVHNGGEWNAISGEERIAMPVAVDPPAWVLAAIGQKLNKGYDAAAAAKSVLVVDYELMELYDFELWDLAQILHDAPCPFLEVWVVPRSGGKSKRIPVGETRPVE